MSKRFNFLVQFMIVAFVFGWASMPVQGQLRSTSNSSNSTTSTSDIGGGDGCLREGNGVKVYLLLPQFSGIEMINQVYDCDLYVGITSNLSAQTTYKPLSSFIDISNGEIIHVNGILATEYGIAMQIPTTKTNCVFNEDEGGGYSEYQTFTLNIYCNIGGDMEEVNACELGNLIFSSLLQKECSFHTEIVASICCNSVGFDGLISLVNAFPNALKISTNYNQLTVTSVVNRKYSTRYSIFNLNGQEFINGVIDLEINGVHELDISDLPAGIYISNFKDFEGRIQSNKFIKI